MSIQVIDNCLSEANFNAIAQTLTCNTFPWFYLNTKVGSDYGDAGLYDHQFVHNFYDKHVPKSPRIDLLEPIISLLNPTSLVRIKANLTICTSDIIQFPMHIDMGDESDNCMTAIYYVNTNNGYTVFESGERVASVANRLAVFNTKIRHTGTTCSNTKNRCVINFNYYVSSYAL